MVESVFPCFDRPCPSAQGRDLCAEKRCGWRAFVRRVSFAAGPRLPALLPQQDDYKITKIITCYIYTVCINLIHPRSCNHSTAAHYGGGFSLQWISGGEHRFQGGWHLECSALIQENATETLQLT